jgi:hypothetical protein
MGTAFSTIITQHAMNFIEDPRWQEQLALNPAQFFRAKSLILENSIPRFNRPYNIQQFLTYSKESFGDYEYQIDEDTSGEIVIETGLTGYELCSTGILTPNGKEAPTYTGITNTYDAETGNVTIQAELVKGQSILCDFYTDGVFDYDLDMTQCRILGLCMACDWHRQFANAYLNVANLVIDKTFNVRSASEHMRVNTERLRTLEQMLSQELLAYEQKLFALKYVNKTIFPTPLG